MSVPLTDMLVIAGICNSFMLAILFVQLSGSINPRSDESKLILPHKDEDHSMEMWMYANGIFSAKKRLLYMIGVNAFAWASAGANILTDGGEQILNCLQVPYFAGPMLWLASEYTTMYYRATAIRMLVDRYVLREEVIKMKDHKDNKEE